MTLTVDFLAQSLGYSSRGPGAVMAADAGRPRRELSMSGLTFRKIIAALVLTVALGNPGLSEADSAAPGDSAQATISIAAVFNGAWTFLSTLWRDEGCGLDPSGYCLPEEETPKSDAGCGLDPSGHCVS